MSPYNLRSQRRKDYNCYLKNLSAEDLGSLNPVVRVKKLQLPEEMPDILNCTFHFSGDNKIIARKIVKKNSESYNKIFLKWLAIIFLLTSLFYFRDDLQQYDVRLMRESAVEAVHSYSQHIVQFFRETWQKNEKYFKTKVTEDTSKNYFITKEDYFNDPIDPSEIRSLVRIFLTKPQNKENEEEEEEEEKKPTSFIEEQCRKPEFSTKLDGLITNDIDHESLTDYALKIRGAKIVSVFDTKPYGILSVKIWGYTFEGIPDLFSQNYFNTKVPSTILVPWKKPGDCWAFKGSYGRVKIKLWERIKISAISIDHIPRELTLGGNFSSAPKKFSVVAIENENENSRRIYLGTFEYRIMGPPVQKFPISPVVMKSPCRFVEITIESNHGNEEFTCLYRVRVHGHI